MSALEVYLKEKGLSWVSNQNTPLFSAKNNKLFQFELFKQDEKIFGLVLGTNG